MNKGQYKIAALFGKGGAGKDSLCKTLIDEYEEMNIYNDIVSCTTRPKRDYEIDKIDYNFLTVEQFTEKVLNGTMLEATEFNNNFYGTPIDTLNEYKINVGVFNIKGIECLLEDARLDVLPVYINCSNKELIFRMLNREKNPNCHEVCRRFLADEQDFSDIPFEYFNLNNEYKVLKDSAHILHNSIKNFFNQNFLQRPPLN